MAYYPTDRVMTPDDFVVVRTKSDEEAIRQGYTWDEATALHVTNFIEGFVRHSEGKWKSQLFALLNWQLDAIWRLYGWLRPDGLRRFRACYWELSRKSGKTAIAGSLALYHFLADNEPGPRVYLAAVDRVQASLLWDFAHKAILQDSRLSSHVDVLASQKTMAVLEQFASLRVLSADVNNADGPSVSAIIWDELHRHDNRGRWDALKDSGIAREQPMQIVITNAGNSKQSLCWEIHRYAERVRDGELIDLQFDSIVLTAPPDIDIFDKANWYKYNPSLGYTITEEQFEHDLKEAIEKGPQALSNFKRYRFTIWSEGQSLYIPGPVWEACANPNLRIEDFKGQPCWVGGDLSTTHDLCAVVFIFGDSITGLTIFPYFWVPEESAEQREKLNKVPYYTWSQQGFLSLVDGAAMDFRVIKDFLIEMHKEYNIQKLGLDKWSAHQTSIELAEAGLPVVYVQQGFVSLSHPTKEVLRLAMAKLLHHTDNPVLNWCIGNTIVEEDTASNMKPSKKKSREKIDGTAALVDAMFCGISDNFGQNDAPQILWV